MEINADILQNINAQMLIIIPVLIIIGKLIKESVIIKNKYIPVILTAISIILSCGWLFIYADENPAQTILDGVMQGVLYAGLSVYGNQIFKQFKKDE